MATICIVGFNEKYKLASREHVYEVASLIELLYTRYISQRNYSEQLVHFVFQLGRLKYRNLRYRKFNQSFV